MLLSPDAITIGDRVRKDLDDGINDLAQSISAIGQLQPIIIDASKTLLCGARRLRACELLGRDVWAEEASGFDDLILRLKAERDENRCRKEFTMSEAVEMARRVEAIESPKAADRRRATQNNNAAQTCCEDSSQQVDGGRTREKVAAAVGMSFDTLRKAKAVVDAAAEPDADPEVVQAAAQMDETGNVHRAYQAIKAAASKRPPARPKADLTDKQKEGWLAVSQDLFGQIRDYCRKLPSARSVVASDLRKLAKSIEGKS